MTDKHQIDSIRMVAFRRIDGVPTFRDSDIMALYDRMEAGGVHKWMFPDHDIASAAAFLAAMASDNNTLFVAVAVPDNAPIGAGWIYNIRGRSAECAWCFLPDVWGMPGLDGLADWMAQRVLHMQAPDGGYIFDVLWGLTDTDNRAARAFLKLAGGQRAGVLPFGIYDATAGVSKDAIITYCTRKEGDYADIYQVRH